MDSALRTISYIADIGSIVVLMARMRMCETSSEEFSESPDSPGEGNTQYRIICYVFESEDVSVFCLLSLLIHFVFVFLLVCWEMFCAKKFSFCPTGTAYCTVHWSGL